MKKKPVLLIVMAPTGSGKSSLIKIISKLIKVNNFEEFLIDDYIEKNDLYKKKVKKILKKDKFNFDTKIIKQFEKAYFESRLKGCQSNSSKYNVKGCGEVLDHELSLAIQNKKNILFESTGKYYPKWIYDYPNNKINIKKYNYEVIIGITLVSFNELVKGNKKRVLDAISLFKKNNTNPTPRIPDIRNSALKHNINLFINTVNQIIHNDCFKKHHKNSYCGDKPISRFIVVDNNKRPPKLLMNITEKIVEYPYKDGYKILLHNLLNSIR